MVNGKAKYLWIKPGCQRDQMGLWRGCLCIVIFLMVSAEQKNFTIKESHRRGKALKISKKPCSDPSGRKGICTFKWDCINHNGTLMGTCMDGFIFGTCCQYDYDPLFHDDSFDDIIFYDNSNNVQEDHKLLPSPARYSTSTTTTTPTRFYSIPTSRPTTRSTRSTTTTLRPIVTASRPPTTNRPTITTTEAAATTRSTTLITTTNRPNTQLVTWTSIGPTRPPLVPQRPILLNPFPFRPGLNIPQTGWPLGIAFPVNIFQQNRPFQIFRPPAVFQTAQSTVSNQTLLRPGSSFTIFNSTNGIKSANNATTNNAVSLTTVVVPIPQWSTQSSTQSTTTQRNFNRPVQLSSPRGTIRPLFYTSHNVTPSTNGVTTRRPHLDYRKGKAYKLSFYKFAFLIVMRQSCEQQIFD
nr:serine proteinase stubble-like [Parasteatoda tepidariorum]